MFSPNLRLRETWRELRRGQRPVRPRSWSLRKSWELSVTTSSPSRSQRRRPTRYDWIYKCIKTFLRCQQKAFEFIKYWFQQTTFQWKYNSKLWHFHKDIKDTTFWQSKLEGTHMQQLSNERICCWPVTCCSVYLLTYGTEFLYSSLGS